MLRIQSEILVHPRHVPGVDVIAFIPGERIGIRYAGVLEREESKKTDQAADGE